MDQQDVWDEDELSDGQVMSLLQRAEQRVKSSETTRNQLAKAATWQRIPKLETGAIPKPYISTIDGIARTDSSRLLSSQDRTLSNSARRVEDLVKRKERLIREKRATAGSDFFDMPRTDLTPELKTDIRLLQMRSVLDPHRHYKKTSKASIPEYSQVGTIIEGPTEYLTSRLPNKERKRTFVEEVLAIETSTRRFKSKYDDVQASKTSGRKAFYKKLKAKRSRGIHKR